ncbi:DNA polymerase III domain protein [Bifidobacterium actinocoloniiforme DSM 22766]|uniref:DNA polymerase III domain protein n=1 Tax=Bifidobacterium actinocoloniiforme DSM 22766 TaxID=1437605 RepID=A0A086YZX6_9BIFI|nr:3'-5' exonuclease [Bifidobacterium actinocoloniiforme]KFI39826.1 DNA polymerase III domain protein [Bifidobacterium actinocoloniiforme DSM 22766]
MFITLLLIILGLGVALFGYVGIWGISRLSQHPENLSGSILSLIIAAILILLMYLLLRFRRSRKRRSRGKHTQAGKAQGQTPSRIASSRQEPNQQQQGIPPHPPAHPEPSQPATPTLAHKEPTFSPNLVYPATGFSHAAKNADYAVIDTETTGLHKGKEIIDIGVMLVQNGKVTATYSQLIRPQTMVSAAIVSLTGITNEMLAQAPVASQVLPPLLDAIRHLPIMGHNISFDINLINSTAESLGIKPLEAPRIVDTMTIGKHVFPNAANLTLETLLDLLGIHEEEEHRALADAKQTFHCYTLMESASSPRPIMKEQNDRARRRSREKTTSFLRASYLASENTTPRNIKPSGQELEAAGSISVCGEKDHMPLLSKYGDGAWIWLTVRKGYIPKGKYKGYPTIYVSLDGEEIGYITAYQMARHYLQIPNGQSVALAHIRKKNDTLELRLEMPRPHDPIDLTPYSSKTE